MAGHCVTFDEFGGYTPTHTIASGPGRGGKHKRLIVHINVVDNTITYSISRDGQSVGEYKDFNAAIDEYNDA